MRTKAKSRSSEHGKITEDVPTSDFEFKQLDDMPANINYLDSMHLLSTHLGLPPPAPFF
jgi:hypothetical protein